jgi:flagellar hook assembly protein FlgD
MEISSASQIQADYLELLVEQLKHQNPLDPLDSSDMTSQLAQLSSLQQLENANGSLGSINERFSTALQTADRNYANSLLGKTVTFIAEDEVTGELQELKGLVDSAFNDPTTGETLLGVKAGEGEELKEYTLGLGAVILVQN